MNRNHYKKTFTFNLSGGDLGENEYKTDRVASGIEGLDELIEGGFERNSVILICGDAGTGKTTFALQFLYNGIMKYNEPGIFITFEESKNSLYKHVSNYGWNFEDLEKKNKFAVVEYRPHQIAELLREGGGAVRDVIESIKAKRIAVDSLTSYSMLFKTPYESLKQYIDDVNPSGVIEMIKSGLAKGKQLFFVASQFTDYNKLKQFDEFLPFTAISSNQREYLAIGDFKKEAAQNIR